MANDLNSNEQYAIELFTTETGRKALEAIPAAIRNALCAGAKRDLLEAGADGGWGIAKKGLNFARRVGRAPQAAAAGISEMAVRQAIFDEVDGSRARFDGSSIIKRLDLDPKSPAGEPVRQMLRAWGKDGVLTVEGSGFHTKYRVTTPSAFFAAPSNEAEAAGEAADEVSTGAEVSHESGDEAADGDEVTGNVESSEEVTETPAEVVAEEVAEETPVAYTGRKGRSGRRS